MKSFLQFTLLIILFTFSCSSNDNEIRDSDQYSGTDLFNEMSQQERQLLGTWYFAYEVYTLNNGLDSIVNHSLINYGNNIATDTLKFFSSNFVGFNDYCPFPAPNSIANSLKTSYTETAYLLNCFPTYNGGWYIENNKLFNYWGIDGSADTMESFVVNEVNNDSLVFVYRDSTNINLTWAKKRTPVFYKN